MSLLKLRSILSNKKVELPKKKEGESLIDERIGIKVSSWMDKNLGPIFKNVQKAIVTDIKQFVIQEIKVQKGLPGEKGDAGPAGKDGSSGPAGKDGSPDSPQDIATKLNTLTGAVDMSVIKGLQEMFANMQRVFNQRERGGGSPGGGGMGNPQHERFNVTTATSTITLVYKIAAQGEAIMAGRYQGQVLDKDVHYTVGNDYKTITFDSTMQAQFTDGDVVSFTYIRG